MKSHRAVDGKRSRFDVCRIILFGKAVSTFPGNALATLIPVHYRAAPAERESVVRRLIDPEENVMSLGVAHIQPIVALLAGILILIMPHLLNYIVAIYLIVV